MPFPTQKAQLFPPSRLLLWTEGESNSETLTVQTQARSAEFFRGIWLLLNLSSYDRIDSLCFSSLKLQRNWNRNVYELNNVAWITPSRVQFLQKMKASGTTWASQSSAKSLQLLRSPVAVPLGFRDGSVHIGPSLRGILVPVYSFHHSIDSVYWLLFYIYIRCLEKMFHCLHCWQVNKSQYKLRFAVRRLTGYPWGHSQVTLRPLQPFSPTGIAMELCTCSKQLET